MLQCMAIFNAVPEPKPAFEENFPAFDYISRSASRALEGDA